MTHLLRAVAWRKRACACTHTRAHVIFVCHGGVPGCRVEAARREAGPLRAIPPTVGAPRSEAGAQASVPTGSQRPGGCVVHFPLFSLQPAWLPQAGVGARRSPRAGGRITEPCDVVRRGALPLRGDTHLSAPASCFQNRKTAYTRSQEGGGAPASRGLGLCWHDPAGIVPHLFAVFLAVSN